MTISFPVPKLAKQLETEWASEISQYLGCSIDEFLAAPTSKLRFPIETIRVELMDESVVVFRCAFALVSKDKRAIAVFTEHCGHHVLPYHDARVYRDGALVFSQGIQD